MKNFIFLLLFFLNIEIYSQEEPLLFVIEGDSIPSSSIGLDEITVFPPLSFKSYKEKLNYYTIRRKTLKVYPYAILASSRLNKLNERLVKIKGRSNKKRYTRNVEKYIENELSAQLKKLTRTEGQILIKLIYRETGKTVFDLVKELRNGFKAFSYNSLAKLFDISIKTGYNPDKNKEDAIIEDVLKRAYGDNSIILDLD
jgi:hypothetical protein